MERFLKWLDNYWYHYKWHTLIGAAAVIFLAVTITQTVTKVDADAVVMVAGPYDMTVNEKTELEQVLSSVLEDDLNGDGRRLCEVVEIVIMTDEQVAAAKADAAAEGVALTVNAQRMSEARNSLTTELFAGESVVCLIDPAQYANLAAQDGWMPLADVLGSRPDNAADDYSIRLADTAFGQFYEACTRLPDDTLLCVKRRSVLSNFKSEKHEDQRYACGLSLFRSLIAWDFPEGYLPESGE